jgi:hypothetical protein
MLTTKIKRQIALTVLMAVFTIVARELVDRMFPLEA